MFVRSFSGNRFLGYDSNLSLSSASGPKFMKTEQQHRDEIVRFGKMLHQTGLVAATDGNLSVRLENGNVLCTATLMSKGLMEPADLVIVDPSGNKVNGSRGVSDR